MPDTQHLRHGQQQQCVAAMSHVPSAWSDHSMHRFILQESSLDILYTYHAKLSVTDRPVYELRRQTAGRHSWLRGQSGTVITC